jgi:hypothetical protein
MIQSKKPVSKSRTTLNRDNNNNDNTKIKMSTKIFKILRSKNLILLEFDFVAIYARIQHPSP